MGHTALDFENWTKATSTFSYNHHSGYDGLNISATKLYFFLKEKYGSPSVSYSSIANFFPERTSITGNEWCYLFQEDTNFVIITGDDKINIAVFSLSEPPSNLDFEIFANRLNEILQRFSIEKYENGSYDVYINYSFYLKNLILQYKENIEKKLPPAPKQISMQKEDVKTDNPKVKYKYIEFANDYNNWLKAVLDKAQFSLQIQILLPIHFESLINLAFRVKLKKEYYNDKINYGDDPSFPLDIFDFFERLSIPKKIEQIKLKCFQINIEKINQFRKQIRGSYDLREKRNNFLHGNALYFQNLQLKYFVDGNYLVGFPDKAKAMRAIASSISVSTEKKNLLGTIKTYEEWCGQLIDIFDDNDYFKNLVEGISFAYNSTTGGTVSIGVSNYGDLFAPTTWE